ncbi:MAG: M48 family metallopeptidase [Planctomycetota bacterium]
MDFFGAQERAKRKTGWLVVLFVLAVVGIIAAVYFAVAFALSIGGSERIWHEDAFLIIAGGTLLVVGVSSLFRSVQLRGGGGAVAQMLGGTRVHPNADDLAAQTLYNVVEEMAIASGVPMPEVYVLADEAGINAFAAGHSPGDAAVAVTRGTLEALSRDELQGVVAHEFSHILNTDMRLNIRLMSVLFGITCIATGGYLLMRVAGRSTGSSNRKGGGAAQLFFVGIALYAVGSLGKLFATLIKAAVSRQREFLADAASVQFTRNPRGIAGALSKIRSASAGGVVRSPQASEASHMFFADALVHRVTNLFATHPPLDDRIAAIEPLFLRYDAEAEAVRERVRAATPAAKPTPKSPLPQIPGIPSLPGGIGPLGGVLALSPEQIVGAIGNAGPEQLAASRDWLEQLSPALRQATGDACGASALVLALLLDAREDVRKVQFECLAQTCDASVYAEALNLARLTRDLPVQARLPLVDLSLPALRAMAKAQYERFKRAVEQLIAADERVDLFEFALGHLLRRHLARAYEDVRPARVEFNTLLPLRHEVALVLSALAHSGGDGDAATVAFGAGATQIPVAPGSPPLPFQATEACHTKALEAALERLVRVAPRGKQQLMRAAARVVAADGRAQVAELELLRAIADAIEVPVPPLGLAA